MKKNILIACLLLSVNLAGCSLLRPAKEIGRNAVIASLPVYSGPKAGIIVADFEVKTAKAASEMAVSLRKMLSAALTNSNRFLILQRQDLAGIAQGQDPPAADRAPAQKNADLIIAVTVTEFEPQVSGGKAGIGGGGASGSGLLGGLLGASLNKAHLALDIRIVNASTSEVLAAGPIQGQAPAASGTSLTGPLQKGVLDGSLSVYADTPMEKAIRNCILEAVSYISKNIPVEYYKYG